MVSNTEPRSKQTRLCAGRYLPEARDTHSQTASKARRTGSMRSDIQNTAEEKKKKKKKKKTGPKKSNSWSSVFTVFIVYGVISGVEWIAFIFSRQIVGGQPLRGSAVFLARKSPSFEELKCAGVPC